MKRSSTKRSSRRKSSKGGNQPFPLKYFNLGASQPSAPAGSDILPIRGNVVRPSIGGKRVLKTRRARRQKRTKGGFLPSVMGNFVASASKYIVPLTLFAGYKLMTKRKSHK
jgi:hypothetical protein